MLSRLRSHLTPRIACRMHPGPVPPMEAKRPQCSSVEKAQRRCDVGCPHGIVQTLVAASAPVCRSLPSPIAHDSEWRFRRHPHRCPLASRACSDWRPEHRVHRARCIPIRETSAGSVLGVRRAHRYGDRQRVLLHSRAVMEQSHSRAYGYCRGRDDVHSGGRLLHRANRSDRPSSQA